MFLSKFNHFWRRNFSRKLETHNLITISRQAILHNYDFIQNLRPGSQIWPVLKSNAYGHGIQQVAGILKARKFAYVVVDSYYEALKIWEVSSQKVLLIGVPPLANLEHFDYSRLALIVYDQETVHRLGSLAKKIKVHLKLNTGLNRQGIKPEQVPEFLATLGQYPQLELEGVCSHLASADDESENAYTKGQEEKFLQVIKQIKQAGFQPKYLHLANTPGTTKINSEVCNTVRLGLGLYGLNPIDSNDSKWPELNGLRPALRFTSKIIHTIDLEPGDRVSYAGTFMAPKPMKIALLPVGYYEVFTRSMSNRAVIKCRDQFLPLVGNVCMNLSLFDCGGLSLEPGQEVEIVSRHPTDRNSVYELAKLSSTIPYEFLVNLAESLRREVVD